MHVGLDPAEQFRFEEQPGQAEAFHGVALHDGDHAGGKVAADVAQPAGHPGRRATHTSPPGPALGGLAGAVAVECAEDVVPAGVVAGEVGAGPVGVPAAEDEAPAPQPLPVAHTRA